MDTSKANINFLVHDNRSGSTFLAALLDSFDEIGVSIESAVLFYLLKGKKKYETKSDILIALKHIYSDPKFREWAIPENELKTNLLKKLPVSNKEFLHIILKTYFSIHKPNSKYWIYKGGSPYFITKIKSLLPEAKFIFIYRDGRAVFSSKKRAINLTSGDIMEKDPIRAAKLWSRYIDIVDTLADQNDIIMVKYENLICNTEKELQRIYKFLTGEKCTSNKKCAIDTGNYKKKIPRSQIHLHKNVGQVPLKSRINGWKEEISYAERYLYEKVAHNMLKKMGYELTIFEKKSKNIKREIRQVYVRIIFYKLIHYYMILKYYSLRPMDMICKLGLRIHTAFHLLKFLS